MKPKKYKEWQKQFILQVPKTNLFENKYERRKKRDKNNGKGSRTSNRKKIISL
jgi:hypothetical protein